MMKPDVALVCITLLLLLDPALSHAEDLVVCEEAQAQLCEACGEGSPLCTSLTPELLASEDGCANAQRLLKATVTTTGPEDVALLCEQVLALPPASPEIRRAIDKVFAQKRKSISTCYKRITNKHGSAEGKLTLVVTIGADGTTMQSNITLDEVGHQLAGCVKARVAKWVFPALDRPTTVHKTWDFSAKSVREVTSP